MTTNPSPGHEIGALIDERPISALQIRVVILCAFVTLFDGYDIQAMALAVPSLVAEWQLPQGSFGLVLSSALIGIGIGGAAIAPFGDKIGRQRLMVWALAVVGIGSIVTAFSTSLTELFIWRLLTGIGLGASLPNATALTSEFVPARKRATLITLMYCNIAIGGFLGGVLAPPLIDAFGWPGIFVIGGVLPILLSVTFYFYAPESLRYLLEFRPQDRRVGPTVRGIAPGIDAGSVYAAVREKVHRQSIFGLLSATYRSRTLLLWTTYGLNIFGVYLLISWLPTLLGNAGWERDWALRGIAFLQIGGVIGGIFLSWLVDRDRTVSGLTLSFLAAAGALLMFGVLPNDVLYWGPLLFIIGCTASGAVFALNALAAALYPPAIRVTGIGWVGAVTRISAAMAPIAGGWLVQFGFTPVEMLRVLALPAVLCALCILLLPLVWRSK